MRKKPRAIFENFRNLVVKEDKPYVFGCYVFSGFLPWNPLTDSYLIYCIFNRRPPRIRQSRKVPVSVSERSFQPWRHTRPMDRWYSTRRLYCGLRWGGKRSEVKNAQFVFNRTASLVFEQMRWFRSEGTRKICHHLSLIARFGPLFWHARRRLSRCVPR